MSSDEPLQTILAVDDEPTNIQALGNVLKDDYRVQVATSGDGALAMLQAPNRPKPDMILLDIQMPGLDGYEICRRLKADSQTRNIDIIFVTARDAASDEEYGLSLGAVDYITKPFSPAIVRARVDTHMRLRHKSDLLEQQVAELEAQRQARDQALQRSETRRQQIEAIFRAIPNVALTETDLEGTVREASHSAEHMFGYTREPLIGSNIYILHDPSEHAQVQKKIARLQQTGEGYTTECELIRGTGERFRAQLSVAPLLNERGEVVGEIAACIDLSAQFADEQRLLMAQEAAGFGVWDWDLAADQVYWDAACWPMLGYDPAQQGTLAFADWQELVHPEDLERVQPIVESHLAAGSPFTIELRYRCADGSWLWVQGRGQTLRRGADGSPTYMVGTHVDIQQIKEAEQALREHERDLVEVKRIARLGHWILDVDSQELFCSGEVYELFGIDPQAKTLDLETYLDQVLEPDRSQAQSALEQALSGQSFEVEHRIQLPQGNERILLGRGYTEFDAQGRPRIVRGTTQDVTEQRVLQRELAEREAHYRDLVENQPLMIERFLPDTTVTYANPALGDCLGVEPEALIGQRWLDYLPAEERENIEAHLAGSTPSHPVSQFENSMPGKNGMQLWAMWTCRAFFDEAGELSHFQAVGVDITARRRAE
ncbi:PAS domain-containing protein, partial [Halorhodospira halochloris]|uniref:PAS domain-containing protein n=1 Tax=Halorhodospira halochloris TaxID=1052 RepID=UPI001EE8611D